MPRGRPQIHRLWQRLANQHGPLYRVSLPFKKFVVVADPRLVAAVLGRRGLPKTPMYRVTLDVFSFRGRHDNMFTVESTHDPRWLTARKGFAATVSEESVRARFGLVVGATEKLCEALEARVVEEGIVGDENSETKKKEVAPIEMQEASLRLALDVILAAAFEAEGVALEMVKDRKKIGGGGGDDDGDGDGGASGPSHSPHSPCPPLPPPYAFAPCPLLDSLHECFEYIYGSLEKPWLLPLFKAAPFLPAARRHRRQHERLFGHWAKLVSHVRGRKGTVEQLEKGEAPRYDGSYGSCLVSFWGGRSFSGERERDKKRGREREEEAKKDGGSNQKIHKNFLSLSKKKKKKKNQVRLIDPKTGKLQKDEQILSQASATVVAGMDTTAHALSFALLCIATTPGVQGRVAAELAALGLLVGSSSSDSHPSASAAPPPRPRALEYADLSRIPYLTAVIKESMRLWPVGGAGVGRVADRDVDIGGFLVKKGTEVAVPMFCLHRAPWAWTDAEKFDPRRWLEEGEEEEGGKGGGKEEKKASAAAAAASDATATVTLSAASSSKANPSSSSSSSAGPPPPQPLRLNQAAYLPFSSGPRDCLGRRFGMMELGTMLAMLCSRFEFAFDEQLNEGGLAGLEAREVSKFTLSFDGGLWLKATPR